MFSIKMKKLSVPTTSQMLVQILHVQLYTYIVIHVPKVGSPEMGSKHEITIYIEPLFFSLSYPQKRPTYCTL